MFGVALFLVSCVPGQKDQIDATNLAVPETKLAKKFEMYQLSEMSVLMAWLFSKTKGSLLPMIIWHFVYNLLSHVLLWERFNIHLFIVQCVVFAIVGAVIVISNKKIFFNRSTPKVKFQNM